MNDAHLPSTERRNPRTVEIDQLPALQILRMLNDEDRTVAQTVDHALPELALAVDMAVEALRSGGRIHYFGAGTSGRLGVMDAIELRPTFGIDADLVVGHVAGGSDAFVQAVENAEDDRDAGRAAADQLRRGDVAIGLSVSGSTPYVEGALERAAELGAGRILFTAVANGGAAALVDTVVLLDTGPEAITGSTRLKAGTAQKMALNAFSTAVMVLLGHTWSNLMASLLITNDKLWHRAVRILGDITREDKAVCEATLQRCDGDLRVAIVHATAGVAPDIARASLESASWSLKEALVAARDAGDASEPLAP